jgi:hypothetical protein
VEKGPIRASGENISFYRYQYPDWLLILDIGSVMCCQDVHVESPYLYLGDFTESELQGVARLADINP